MEFLMILALIVGPIAGWAVWNSINKKYRNAGARYAPEQVVGQQVFDLKADDHFRRQYVSRSATIEHRNDDNPTIPAAYFNAVKK
jgi:hypothetical protein